MKYLPVNRVDIQQGHCTLAGFIGEQEVLTKHQGRDWTIAPGASLQDIVTVSIALLEFLE